MPFSGIHDEDMQPDWLKELHDLRIKYDGRLAELRQCEEDRNQAWEEVRRLKALIYKVIAGDWCVTDLQESIGDV